MKRSEEIILDQSAAPAFSADQKTHLGSLPLSSRLSPALSGEVDLPGDKSVSHRALIFGALAVGETRIEGLLEGDDVLATARALRAYGVEVVRDGPGAWRVWGTGIGGFEEPTSELDLGNAGTAVRLLMGVAAHYPFASFFTGDASLRSRPMSRATKPLIEMGARVTARSGCRLPLALTGSAQLVPITYTLPIASAQVKSALLLAGLAAPGETSVIEPSPSRDHSERMLRYFGAEIGVADDSAGARIITLTGQPELAGRELSVPADISSAAFPLAAALIVPDSQVLLRNVGVNPLRTGLLDCVREMGGDIKLQNARDMSGEPVADIAVVASTLRGIDVPTARVPRMIDEYPILAILAACANGQSRLRGLDELRHKESDRFASILVGLSAAGVSVSTVGDDILINGKGAPPSGGAKIESYFDHRIAMAFVVLGLACPEGMVIDNGAPIATSFPDFVDLMNGLGARIENA